jgi:hypothetical protein
MAFDEKLARRVRDALVSRRDLSERKMMGGLCFMIGGNMCCGVTGDALMVRVGPDGYAAALAKPHVRPLEFAGRRPGGFVLVDPAGFSRSFAKWLQTGIDVASALPKKPAKKRARSGPRAKRARSG